MKLFRLCGPLAALLAPGLAAATPDLDDLDARLAALEAKLQAVHRDAAGDLVIEGVNLRVVDGTGTTECDPAGCNGKGNVVVGYDEDEPALPRPPSALSGAHTLVIGVGHRREGAVGLVQGRWNITRDRGTFAAGSGVRLLADGAVGVGWQVHAEGVGAAAVGGNGGTASGDYALILGGAFSEASGNNAAAIGGSDHTAIVGTTVGGDSLLTDEAQALALGGRNNGARKARSVVVGGRLNAALEYYAGVFGGRDFESSDLHGAAGVVSGPQGATGDKGDQGATGDRGPDGAQGAPGPAAERVLTTFACNENIFEDCDTLCGGHTRGEVLGACQVAADDGTCSSSVGRCCVCEDP